MNSFYPNYYFNGELGRELIYLREISLNYSLPLVGLTTSHEWLSYGPFYYWIMLPIFNFLNGDPYSLFYTALTTAVLGLMLNYFIIKKIINKKTAVISTILLAISPLLIWQTRLSKLHTFFFILNPILMFFLYKLWNNEKKYLFFAGLIYGLMFSFHLSQIPILAAILCLLFIKKYNIKSYLILYLGIFIPNIGLVINNIKLLIWIPYRIIKYPIIEAGNTFNSIYEYLGKSIFWNDGLWLVPLLLSVYLFINYIKLNYKNLKKDFVAFYLISFIGITFIANVLHGGAPVHYFLPIFTVLPLLFAKYLSSTKYWPIALLFVFLINFNFYFHFTNPADFISIEKQNNLSKQIVAESDNKEINLKRIGPNDNYPEDYSQNYKYLILWNGGKLNNSSNYNVTINEYEYFNLK